MGDRPDQRLIEESTAQVLRFRPRTSASAPRRDISPIVAADDALDPAPDDFRHRMMVNLAGLACAAALTAAGIWLASTISEMRRTQDCVLIGRRDCAPVQAVRHQPAALRQH